MGPCWSLANNDPLSVCLLTHRHTHNLAGMLNKDGIVKDSVHVCMCTHRYLCMYVHVQKHPAHPTPLPQGDQKAKAHFVSLTERKQQKQHHSAWCHRECFEIAAIQSCLCIAKRNTQQKKLNKTQILYNYCRFLVNTIPAFCHFLSLST